MGVTIILEHFLKFYTQGLYFIDKGSCIGVTWYASAEYAHSSAVTAERAVCCGLSPMYMPVFVLDLTNLHLYCG